MNVRAADSDGLRFEEYQFNANPARVLRARVQQSEQDRQDFRESVIFVALSAVGFIPFLGVISWIGGPRPAGVIGGLTVAAGLVTWLLARWSDRRQHRRWAKMTFFEAGPAPGANQRQQAG